MARGIDEQVLAEMAPLFAALGDAEPAPIGDVEARGASAATGCSMWSVPGALRSPASTPNGTPWPRRTARWWISRGITRPAGDGPGSAALYLHGGVSPYAAPARADDLTGLPDTYIEVGDLDVFRNEDIAYARRLADAGVPTELHVYPGCPHAFEALARGAPVSKRAISDRVRRLRAL